MKKVLPVIGNKDSFRSFNWVSFGNALGIGNVDENEFDLMSGGQWWTGVVVLKLFEIL